jgi:phosphohistidine swiveling domain-containing protein
MKPNFQKLITRKHALLTNDILTSAWSDKKLFAKITGLRIWVENIEIIDGDFCFDLNWFEKITRKYKYKKLKFFWNFINKGYANGEKIKSFSRQLKIGNDINKLKNDFFKSVELLKNLLVFPPETLPLTKVIEDNVIAILIKKGVKGADINETLLEVSAPKKLNGPSQEIKDLLILKNKLNNPGFDINMALCRHAKKYSYLGYREPFSRGYPASFFKKRLNNIFPDKKKNKEIIKFNKEEIKYIDLIKELVYFRNYRTEKLYEALYYIEPLWLKIEKIYKLRKNDLGYYFLKEIMDLFENNKKINRGEISKRKEGHAAFIYNGKRIFLFGEDLKRKKISLQPKETAAREVRGMVVCRGKAIGTAKVIFGAREQAKIKKGDIIITSMTTPDLLSCMKKAAAFVTDEGGITCHAAIVARELNKPCVIGTKIATQVLRDGDFVEVDADKGVVKILKRVRGKR